MLSLHFQDFGLGNQTLYSNLQSKMDAAYLKKNVMEALTEALTAMAVKIPDDNIDFVGKYLLKYVERKKSEKEAKENLANVETNLVQFLANQEASSKVEVEKKQEQHVFNAKYKRFLDSLQFDFSSKQDAMDAAVNFIETSLDIPAAYIAVKKMFGETEVLNYVAAGPSQQNVKGKKLLKPAAEEGDEAPARQGISFEAFKLPEVPEEEEPVEETEDGVPAVVKPPPKAQPLIVENAMREQRCKFFGIPRLGAYAAIPCSYQSVEHEEGCVMGTVEEGSEVPADYVFQPKEVQFIIGVDTVGKFRSFKVNYYIIYIHYKICSSILSALLPILINDFRFTHTRTQSAEIERLVELGDGLVKLFGVLDKATGEKQKEFLKSAAYQKINEGVQGGEFAAKLAEAEAAAVGEATAALAAQQAADAAAAPADGEVDEGELIFAK